MGIPQNDINDLKTCPLGPEEETYVEMLKEYKSQEEEIEKNVEDLQCSMQEGQNEIEQLIRHSVSQEQANFETLHTNFDKRYTKERDEVFLQKLAKHNFKSKIRSKVKFYHPGTREWLLPVADPA